jgi:predicted aldo/keto reductase-like oxidoreductase
MVRFIGISNHKLSAAMEAAASGLYDTIQFPLSSISSDKDLKLVDECRKHDVGLIAMKGLSGGLITNAASTFAFLRQYDNVLPIWGIQRERELDEFLSFEKNPPLLDDDMWCIIEKDRKDLAGSFCRACGYCMPCPAGIPIPTAARMSLLLRRAPYQQYLADDWKEKMELITECRECGQCRKRCPYGLDTPNLLKGMLDDYRQFSREHKVKI